MTAPITIDDGLEPPPPAAPYFDAARGVWVLSRYADVLAAFRDSRLLPVSSGGEDHGNARDDRGSLLERGAVRDGLSTSNLAEWQRQMAGLADATLERLPTDRPVDLLQEFAKPWCMSLALMVTGAGESDRKQLGELGDNVFSGTGEPKQSPQKLAAAAAVAELESYFQTSPVPMAQPTFVGVSQTLPRLLVNGWLALFRHPAEVARLRTEPELMSHAVEELLRYAGIIPRLFRKARVDADLGVVKIAAGERADLMIASANRDPEKFPAPALLDVSRRATGQLALGIGHNSCAGARLIRMANGVAIGSLLKTFGDVTVTGAVQWRTGSGFCWPASVHFSLRR